MAIIKQLTKWVEKKLETKAQNSPPIIAMSVGGQTSIWASRDYAQLARIGFCRNPIVYRSIRMIAEAAATVPWLLYDGDVELSEHDLLQLLEKPNNRQGGIDLFENIYANLAISGNAYIEATAIDNKPRELHALRPDRTRITVNRDGWPSGFEYTTANRIRKIPIFDDHFSPVLHLTLYNPLDDHYGISPLEAAQISLDIHNCANQWNKSLLDNSARPSGALVYSSNDDSRLSEEQFERLKQELEYGFQGAVNAGRPILLEGGLDWKAIALSPRDMDFIATKNSAAREIALAFGVPPMLLGIPGDNTYANYQEANRAFWRQTILPLVGRTAKALTNWFSPLIGPTLRLWYDPDMVEALSSERESLWRRINNAKFLSDNEKRIAVGYGIKTNMPKDNQSPIS